MTRIRFEDLPSTNTPRNAENLNKLNNVVISPTEPTTGEEVWIDNTNKKIHTKNDNGVYEEFTEDTGWLSLNKYISYRKKNGVVYIRAEAYDFEVGNGSYTTVGTLPKGFRPVTVTMFAWTGISGDVKNQSARITNEGVIGLYLPSGQGVTSWAFMISYPVD